MIDMRERARIAGGAVYRVAWDSGLDGMQAYSVCDACFLDGKWPEHWPGGRWKFAGNAVGVRPCLICGRRMETPVGYFQA